MDPLDRRVVAFHSILHSSRRTAHLLQVGHATVARWVKSPNQKSYPKRAAPKTEILNTCLRTIIVHNPLISIKSIQSIVFTLFSSSVSTQLVRCVIKSNSFTKKKARGNLAASSMTHLTSSRNVTNFCQKGDDLFL